MSELIATRIFNMMEDLMLGEEEPVALNVLLTPQQKYELTYAIVRILPKTDLRQVQDFHEAFKVAKENTHVVQDFKYSKLRLSLILEEAMELGLALGFNNATLYGVILDVYTKIKNKDIEANLVEIADALADLRVVVNGASDVFNLSDINQELMEEVTKSNMSKLIPTNHPDVITIATLSRDSYTAQGVDTVTEDLKNGYMAIKNRETGKILKPITFVEPDLKTIINNHLNK